MAADAAVRGHASYCGVGEARDDVAIKVMEPVHEHDAVYRVVEESLEQYFN